MSGARGPLLDRYMSVTSVTALQTLKPWIFWRSGDVLTLFPHATTIVGRGVVCLQLAPPRPPGTDLKVRTESRRHEEVLTGRWCRELRVIHTN